MRDAPDVGASWLEKDLSFLCHHFLLGRNIKNVTVLLRCERTTFSDDEHNNARKRIPGGFINTQIAPRKNAPYIQEESRGSPRRVPNYSAIVSSERRVIEIAAADNRFEFSIRRWGERENKKGGGKESRGRKRASGPHRVHGACTVIRMILCWRGTSSAVYYVRAIHRVRGYIRVTSDAFRKSSCEMRRVAQPWKKHALLGNIPRKHLRTYVYIYIYIYTKRWEKNICVCVCITHIHCEYMYAPWAA